MTRPEPWNGDRFLEALSHKGKHDFSAGIRSICSFSTMLSEESDNSLSSDAKAYLDFINVAGNRLDTLMQRMTLLIRIQEPSTKPESLNLSNLLGARRDTVILDPDIGVNADAHLLGLALDEIIENATRYGKPPIRIDQETDGVIRITDNGPGIDQARIEAALKPFYRQVPNKHSPGAGLGFSICAAAMERMGGYLDVTVGTQAGAEREGLVVHLHLPVSVPDEL